MKAYFKQKVIIAPFDAEMPLWLWDITVYSLYIAAIGIIISTILVVIELI